jgi:hypothetical protein
MKIGKKVNLLPGIIGTLANFYILACSFRIRQGNVTTSNKAQMEF